MSNHSSICQFLALLLAALAVSGRTGMRPVTETSSMAEQVTAGDRLVVDGKTGRIVDMTLQVIEIDRLVGTIAGDRGEAIEVPSTNVDTIEVKQHTSKKTALSLKCTSQVKLPILVLHGKDSGRRGFWRAPNSGHW